MIKFISKICALFILLFFIMGSNQKGRNIVLSIKEKEYLSADIINHIKKYNNQDSADFSNYKIILSNEIVNNHTIFKAELLQDRKIKLKFKSYNFYEHLLNFKRQNDSLEEQQPWNLRASPVVQRNNITFYYSRSFENYFTVTVLFLPSIKNYKDIDDWYFQQFYLFRKKRNCELEMIKVKNGINF